MPRPAPDLNWLPFLKLAFGILIIVILAVLAAVIAIGKVEAATSFGLQYILGALASASGAFTVWAFTGNDKRPPSPPSPPSPAVE
jgi:hypothetical protein